MLLCSQHVKGGTVMVLEDSKEYCPIVMLTYKVRKYQKNNRKSLEQRISAEKSGYMISERIEQFNGNVQTVAVNGIEFIKQYVNKVINHD